MKATSIESNHFPYPPENPLREESYPFQEALCQLLRSSTNSSIDQKAIQEFVSDFRDRIGVELMNESGPFIDTLEELRDENPDIDWPKGGIAA